MSLWHSLFGPSKLDRLLDVIKEDRAAQTAVLTAFLDTAKAQTALVQKQYDLLTAPQPPPEVRVMTPEFEAKKERERTAKPGTSIAPDALLADLGRDFRTLSDSFQ